ncbi:MAG: hypothetical protein CML47_01350 [Rhodobacteraceae bacterium]|nr:MAG: hypothetical protein CML47_01350 [Paracoccaceae bacterium]|tara:strand:- start:5909 stop:6454 length:546 start_codon:yes stop_codon:yes gene_type:complete
MKTRKKHYGNSHKRSLKKIAEAPHKLHPYLVIYNDILAEFTTKLSRFKAEFQQCNKWKPLNTKDFKILNINIQPILQKNILNSTNPVEEVKKTIQPLRFVLNILNKDFITLHAISQVEYRKKYGLLHTLPQKKMNIFESVYKGISLIIPNAKKQYKSKIQQRKILPHIHKKVRFSSKITKY